MKTILDSGKTAKSRFFEKSMQLATTTAALIYVLPNTVTGIQTPEQVGKQRGFIFDVINKEQIIRQADITDHYIEDNRFLHNHISKKPLAFSISGYKGEVQDALSSGDDVFTSLVGEAARLVDLAFQSANLISGVIGKSAVATTNALDSNYKAQQLYKATALVASNGIKNFTFDKLTRQEKAFKLLNEHFENHTLFTVQTPYGRYSNMVIQELRVTQAEDSNSYSDFELTFKQIRKVATSLQSIADANSNKVSFTGGKATDGTVQSSSAVDKGVAT